MVQKQKSKKEEKKTRNELFKPNAFADVKHALFDLLEDNDTVTTEEVYKYIKDIFQGAAPKRCMIDMILAAFCSDGIIAQKEDPMKPEYYWCLNETAKALFISEDGKAEPVVEAKKNVPHADKHTMQIQGIGDVTCWTIEPKNYNAEDWKGYYCAESDEALELFIFEKTMKTADIKDIVAQVVNCDKASVKVKKV